MSKTILKLILVVVIILLIDWCFVPFIIKSSYENINFDHYCFEQSDILILGDSHTQKAVNPNHQGFNGRILNFSKTGNYLPLSYAIYMNYREEYEPPKILILSAQAWMFKDEPYSGNYYYLKNKKYGEEYFDKKYSLNENFKKLVNFNLNIIEDSQFITEFTLRLVIRTISGKENKCISGNDFMVVADNPVWRQHISDSQTEPNNYIKSDYIKDRFSVNESMNKLNVDYLKKFLSVLEKDNVQVILLETPEFIGSTKSLLNKNMFYKELDLLKEEYNNIKIWKHDEFSLDESDPKLFFDGGWGQINSHMNYVGVKIFSEVFFRKVNDSFEND